MQLFSHDSENIRQPNNVIYLSFCLNIVFNVIIEYIYKCINC